MKIEIHDVEHGGCAVVTGPNGDRLMLDCGYNLAKPWFPSIAYRGQLIQTLMLLNLDEDHVQDLPHLLKHVPINGLVSNPTVTASALQAMKAKGMRAGVQAAHGLLNYFQSGMVAGWAHGLGGVSWEAFWNVYGRDFTDTNNLSLAVFISWGGFTILFGGDMECAGWERLLERPEFIARLREVKIYVASHHGRDNGRCENLFKHMRPDVVVFSDGAKVHETQETTNWYGARAPGIVDTTRSQTSLIPVTRKVMTTRSDGTLTIQVRPDGGYTLFYPPKPSVSELLSFLQPEPHSALSLLLGTQPSGLLGLTGR